MIGPLALALFVQVAAPLQQLAPGTRYDPTVPTLEQVAGHDFGEEITPPEEVPGSILRVILDREHWLSAGTDGDIGVLVEGTRVFSPITLDHGTNVGRYADVDRLVMSGVVWDGSRPAEETELLFMNAVLLGPGR